MMGCSRISYSLVLSLSLSLSLSLHLCLSVCLSLSLSPTQRMKEVRGGTRMTRVRSDGCRSKDIKLESANKKEEIKEGMG